MHETNTYSCSLSLVEYGLLCVARQILILKFSISTSIVVFSPPGPTAVGSGGFFCVILIHFFGCSHVLFLKTI